MEPSPPRGGAGGGGGHTWPAFPQPKYAELTPSRPVSTDESSSASIQLQHLRNTLSLLLTNSSADDSSSIDIPSSIVGDDSTISSFPPSPRGLEKRTCCGYVSLKHYLMSATLFSFILFIWCSAIGFFIGLFLGLIGSVIDVLYLYMLYKKTLIVHNPRRAKYRKIFHYTVLILSYLALYFLALRLVSARDFVNGSFPSRCYPNVFGTVPPSCVRVVGKVPPDDDAHGLISPLVHTPDVQSVANLVNEWANKQWQTKMIYRTSTFFHMVATSAVFGFHDDLAVDVSCVNGYVLVKMQSEQRLGTLDANINRRRVASLISYIKARIPNLPQGACSVR